MSNITKFENLNNPDGTEFVVDSETKLVYASVSTIVRMLKAPRATVQRRLKKCPLQDVIIAKIVTAGGLQDGSLYPVVFLFELALIFKRELLAAELLSLKLNESAQMLLVAQSYGLKSTKEVKVKALKQSLYIIQCQETKVIKIGISICPIKRLVTIQTSYPYKLDLVRTIVTNSARDLESSLHKALADFKLQGEWFDGLALTMIALRE